MTERLACDALVRIATVLATAPDFPTGTVFQRHIGHLADVIDKVPDDPRHPLCTVRIDCLALIEARLSVASADWSTLVWRLRQGLHGYAVIAAARALEALEARSGA